MSRDSIRHQHNLSFENDAKPLRFDPDLHLTPHQTNSRTNGINGEHGEIIKSKSTNNASVSSSTVGLSETFPFILFQWKSTGVAELTNNIRAQSVYLNAVLDAISLNEKKKFVLFKPFLSNSTL